MIFIFFFFLMIRRPPRSTLDRSSAASDVYKRQAQKQIEISDDSSSINEGVLLVFNKLRNTLEARGVKPMETIGEEFNADLHEAVTEIPAPTKDLIGKVVDEILKGYYLNDKIIRHAKVVVGK